MDETRFTRVLWIVKAALLAVLLYLGFGVVMNHLGVGEVFNPGTASGEQPAADSNPALPQALSPSDYAAIAEGGLFATANNTGPSQAATPPAPAPKAAEPPEELGLRLIGTIAGGPTASRAIIHNTKTNNTGAYKVGDTIASATIQTIQRDAVILLYEGKSLTLKLQAGTPGDKRQKPRAGGQKAPRAAKKTDAQKQPSSGPTTAPATSGGNSLAEVFRKIKIEPSVKDNQVEGLKISGLENIPMAGVLGFKNGDIVQSIDGQSLTSKQKAFQVLMKARTQPKVNIRLLRDGKTKDLSFNL